MATGPSPPSQSGDIAGGDCSGRGRCRGALGCVSGDRGGGIGGHRRRPRWRAEADPDEVLNSADSGASAVVAACAASSPSTCSRDLREHGNDGHMDLVCVTVDCAAPATVVGFWSEALRWRDVRVARDGSGAVCRSPVGGVYLEFIRVPEGKTVKNRLHLGCTAGDLDRLDDEIGRLEELGATVAWEEKFPTEWQLSIATSCCETSKATSSASVLVTCRAHRPLRTLRYETLAGTTGGGSRARRSTCRLDAPVAGPDRSGSGGDRVRLCPRRRRPA